MLLKRWHQCQIKISFYGCSDALVKYLESLLAEMRKMMKNEETQDTASASACSFVFLTLEATASLSATWSSHSIVSGLDHLQDLVKLRLQDSSSQFWVIPQCLLFVLGNVFTHQRNRTRNSLHRFCCPNNQETFDDEE